jgi:hypothetical protein
LLETRHGLVRARRARAADQDQGPDGLEDDELVGVAGLDKPRQSRSHQDDPSTSGQMTRQI